jgi:hypothetical protein
MRRKKVTLAKKEPRELQFVPSKKNGNIESTHTTSTGVESTEKRDVVRTLKKSEKM